MAWTFNKPVFRPDSIPTGLVGYWKFNNDATDSSGKGYDLTPVNTPAYAQEDYWKSGEYSTDLVPASNHRFTRARNADLDLLNAFTICVWVKADDVTSVQIIDKDQANDGYGIYLDASSKAILNMRNGARATSATAISAGKWTHLAFVYDQTNAMVYINGNLDIASAYSTDCTDEATDLTIAALNDGTLDWDGHLKDLSIHSVALTPIQIKSLAFGVDLSKYAYRPNHVSVQPTAWWKLNEVSGNRADSSGNGYTLTDNNTVLSSGGYIEGIGADFENSNAEHLSLADNDNFELDADISFFVWIKREAVGVLHGIVSKGNGVGENGYEMYIDNGDNQIKVYLGNGGIESTTKTIPAGTWCHVGFTYDYSEDELKIYIDGQADLTSTLGASPSTNSSEFRLGEDAGGTNEFDGVMSDACFWHGYVVTPAEAASLAAGIPIQQQGIVSYWKMDETSGNATDSIGTNTGVETSGTIESSAGKVGTARDFEAGDTEYFESANSDSLDITSDLTIMGWIKPESHAVPGTILDKDGTSDGYGLRFVDDSTVKIYIANSTQASTLTIADGSWGHATGIWDGLNKVVYVNGVASGTSTTATAPSDTTAVLNIGSLTGGGSIYYDGLIDELILAKRYFRPEEIKTAYLKGLNGKEVTTVERPVGNMSQVIWID